MNSQELMDEIYERVGEKLEHDKDNYVLIQALICFALEERNKNEDLKMKLKRLEVI
jgi:hypothetical protein